MHEKYMNILLGKREEKTLFERNRRRREYNAKTTKWKSASVGSPRANIFSPYI
jgi:hypothetical protein